METYGLLLGATLNAGTVLAIAALGLPKSLTGVFQGLLLFSLLACDVLMNYRLRWQASRTERV